MRLAIVPHVSSGYPSAQFCLPEATVSSRSQPQTGSTVPGRSTLPELTKGLDPGIAPWRTEAVTVTPCKSVQVVALHSFRVFDTKCAPSVWKRHFQEHLTYSNLHEHLLCPFLHMWNGSTPRLDRSTGAICLIRRLLLWIEICQRHSRRFAYSVFLCSHSNLSSLPT